MPSIWPRQQLMQMRMTIRLLSVSATISGNAHDVALLAIALAEIASDQPIRYCTLPREHAAVSVRIDRQYCSALRHLVKRRGLVVHTGILGSSDPTLTFSILPLGVDQLTLKKHPRLQWDQSPCQWYVCYDTAQATLFHYLEDKVPCAFYQTRAGGLTYCFASGSKGFYRNFLNAESLSWRTAVGLPHGQVPVLQAFATEESRAA